MVVTSEMLWARCTGLAAHGFKCRTKQVNL